jgi:hypothetical protein
MKEKTEISKNNRNAFIQIIDLEWDKSARGGELAARRNAIPTSFAVPVRPPGQNGGELINIEKQYWNHSNGFVRPAYFKQEQQSLTEKHNLGCISVYYLKGELKIIYTWDHTVGAPRRPLTKKLMLPSNKWAQIRWNGRSSRVVLGAWWYKQATVNIGLFDGQVKEDIFVNTKPDLQFEQLASLW